jgi:hypothetical protein
VSARSPAHLEAGGVVEFGRGGADEHGGQVDGMRLLSPRTVQEIAVVHSRGPDLVLVLPMGWRLGYHSASREARNLGLDNLCHAAKG